jgi:hypothetical protein
MSDDASTQTTPDSTPPHAAEAEGGKTPSTPGQETPAPAANEDAIYDQAFANILGPDAPDDPATPAPATPDPSEAAPDAPAAEDASEAAEEQETPASTAQQTPQLSDADRQLLSRQHMKESTFAKLDPDEQREFLANAAKRERDQTEYVRKLREQAKQRQEEEGGETEDEPGDQQQATRETPAHEPGELVQQAQKAVDELTEVYGDEMKPLGDVLGSLATTAEQLNTRLERSESAGARKDQLIVEMTLDAGMRDLQGDFPSLEKAEARERVIKRFQSDWASPESRHRTAQGPLLDRIRAAMRDAASAEFSSNTESAAQVALVNKTKERLRNQPHAGSAKGRKPPQSEDDIYDDAFEQTLAPELRT